ncbi:unnamed protein product [Boreogadus saida]
MARTALFLLLWILTWLGDAKSTYPQRYSLYSGQTQSPQHNSAAHGARAASRHSSSVEVDDSSVWRCGLHRAGSERLAELFVITDGKAPPNIDTPPNQDQ